ncbi:MAG: hypothetical protein CSA33_03115 [Desulfobulbus propionicus]|nr:MAG: hypothetical protein CSA33_03115 [Desulfobulbus propionicus]
MHIITFRYQRFNAAIQEEKNLETDTAPAWPYGSGALETTTSLPDPENEIYNQHIQRIKERKYEQLFIWQ